MLLVKLMNEMEFQRAIQNPKVKHAQWSDCLQPHRQYSPWNSPGQNIGVDILSLLQDIFPAQRSNPGLPHCRQILYQLSYKRSLRILGWVAYSFSWPRNRTGVSSIAGRFFTNWAIREAQNSKRWWYQSVALNMSANLEDPAVITGLENVNPHLDSHEG